MPAAGVEYARLEGVTDFELYVETTLAGARFRLARRWWLPSGGVVVDTGLILGP